MHKVNFHRGSVGELPEAHESLTSLMIGEPSQARRASMPMTQFVTKACILDVDHPNDKPKEESEDTSRLSQALISLQRIRCPPRIRAKVISANIGMTCV